MSEDDLVQEAEEDEKSSVATVRHLRPCRTTTLVLTNCAQLSPAPVTPWAEARQAPLPMESSNRNLPTWCHFPLLGIFPDLGIERASTIGRRVLHHPAGWGGPSFLNSASLPRGSSFLLPQCVSWCASSECPGSWAFCTGKERPRRGSHPRRQRRSNKQGADMRGLSWALQEESFSAPHLQNLERLLRGLSGEQVSVSVPMASTPPCFL